MAQDGTGTVMPPVLGAPRPGAARRLLGATANSWIGQVSAQTATGLMFVAVARSRSTDDFGRAAICYALALAGAQLVDLGAQQRLLRDIARGTVSRHRMDALRTWKPLAALAMTPVAAAVVLACTGSAGAAVPVWLYSVLRGSQLMPAQAVWQAQGRSSRAGLAVASERVLALVAVAVLLRLGVSAAVALSVGLTVGVALVSVPCVAALRSAVPPGVTPARGRPLRDALSFGRHFAAASIAANLLLFDTVLVGAVAGEQEAGFYGLGARLLGPLLVVTTSLCLALVPAAVQPGGSLRLPLALVTGVTMAGLVAVYANAPRLVTVVAGADYLAAVPAVRAFVIAAAFVAIAQPVASWLQAVGDERWVSRVVPGGMLSALAAATVGASVAGATGAALGQGAVHAVATVVLIRRLLTRRRAEDSGQR